MSHQGCRTQSVLLFTHSWRENNWIHTFPKGISAMQLVSYRIWTRVSVSISYDNNHYTTGTSKYDHFDVAQGRMNGAPNETRTYFSSHLLHSFIESSSTCRTACTDFLDSLSLSLAIRPYHPSLPAGLLDYITCPNRAVVDKFWLLVQHLPVLVKGSIGEGHLWVRPYLSRSVHMSSSYLGGFRVGR